MTIDVSKLFERMEALDVESEAALDAYESDPESAEAGERASRTWRDYWVTRNAISAILALASDSMTPKEADALLGTDYEQVRRALTALA